jgi:hypothetical protein
MPTQAATRKVRIEVQAPQLSALWAWIFDSTFERNAVTSNRWLQLIGLSGSGAYRPEWFDTWAGKYDSSAPSVTIANGELLIPLRAFPAAADQTTKDVGDRNDIALRLKTAR